MIGDPLVSDSRLREIEGRVRKSVPGLPEAARFVTYVQEPTLGERSGIEVPVHERVAVAAIVLPDPKVEGRERWIRGSWWLKHFREVETERGRMVGAPDVLLGGFSLLAKRAAQMHRDLVELNP